MGAAFPRSRGTRPMLRQLVLCAIAAVATVDALELTKENFDEKTGGKTAFIKFLAPW